MTLQGKYSFKLHLDLEESSLRRTSSWAYSDSLDKLYVKFMEPCRIGVSFTRGVPSTSVIRLFVEYRPSDVIQEPIVRCQKHAKNSKDPHLFPDHVIRCDYPNASYHRDGHTHFRSITVPVSALTKESDCHILEFKYVCYSSCLSKRGSIHSVFVLQDGEAVLGRCSVETRVCASPSRDLRSEELKKHKRELPESAYTGADVFSVSPLGYAHTRHNVRLKNLVERWLAVSDETKSPQSRIGLSQQPDTLACNSFDRPIVSKIDTPPVPSSPRIFADSISTYLHTNGGAHSDLDSNMIPIPNFPYAPVYSVDSRIYRTKRPFNTNPFPFSNENSFESARKKLLLQKEDEADVEESMSSQQTNSQMSLS